MSTYTQGHRHLLLRTPLGKDALLLEGFSGVEGLSEPFVFHLSLRSESHWIEPDDIVGMPVSFGLALRWPIDRDPAIRWFHGIVHRFAHEGRSERLAHYSAEVVPQDWLLTRKADARIFQAKSTPDIVADVLGRGGVDDLDRANLKSYPEREYCVQYRESDRDFVSRLMEDEGIFYAYRRSEDGHRLVLADSEAAYVDCTKSPLNRLSTVGESHGGDDILSWSRRYDFRPGRWTQRDYNFQTPASPLETQRQKSTKRSGADPYEIFLYPGGYGTRGDGDRITRVRMEADDCEYETVFADTTCPDLFPGGKFKVGAHPIEHERDRAWVVTRVEHRAQVSSEFESGGSASLAYTNRITCIPADIVFRPQRRTPKPVMHGIQTAVVVGPEGEEIYVDKYGRVKVHFHWDRHHASDENASCWIRVAQPWAGTTYGSLAIPRIGQEVVVEFEEGNPDRPIINGRLYNASQQVPVTNAGRPGAAPADLTKAAMMTTLRSNSLGKTGGFNEITMDDTSDKETLFVHAQKDNLNKVRNDQSTVIGNDRKESVGKSHTEVIGTDYTLTVGKTLTETVDGEAAVSIKKNSTETIGGSSTLKVKGERKVTIGDKATIEIGKDMTVKVGGAGKVEVTRKHEISAQEIVLKAMKKIEIAVGTSKIILEPAQITIQGTMVASKASAINEVKGALVKINC